MTSLDTRFRALADDLIGRFGKAVTLRRTAHSTYDASTGEAAAGTATDYAVTAVVAAPSAEMLRSGLALSDDRRLLVAATALSIVPQAGDQALMDSETWAVLAAVATFSGEEVAMYELHLRRS